jgi:hypothetical protein
VLVASIITVVLFFWWIHIGRKTLRYDFDFGLDGWAPAFIGNGGISSVEPGVLQVSHISTPSGLPTYFYRQLPNGWGAGERLIVRIRYRCSDVSKPIMKIGIEAKRPRSLLPLISIKDDGGVVYNSDFELPTSQDDWIEVERVFDVPVNGRRSTLRISLSEDGNLVAGTTRPSVLIDFISVARISR